MSSQPAHAPPIFSTAGSPILSEALPISDCPFRSEFNLAYLHHSHNKRSVKSTTTDGINERKVRMCSRSRLPMWLSFQDSITLRSQTCAFDTCLTPTPCGHISVASFLARWYAILQASHAHRVITLHSPWKNSISCTTTDLFIVVCASPCFTVLLLAIPALLPHSHSLHLFPPRFFSVAAHVCYFSNAALILRARHGRTTSREKMSKKEASSISLH